MNAYVIMLFNVCIIIYIQCNSTCIVSIFRLTHLFVASGAPWISYWQHGRLREMLWAIHNFRPKLDTRILIRRRDELLMNQNTNGIQKDV